MRFKLIPAIGISLLAFTSQAQSLERSVFAASGGSGVSASAKLDWTCGESVTANLQNASNIVSQGFQQLFSNNTTSAYTTNAQIICKVFPVPCQQYLNINTILQSSGPVFYHLYNSLGVRVMTGALTTEATCINVGELPEGEYVLDLIKNNSVSNFRIIKSN